MPATRLQLAREEALKATRQNIEKYKAKVKAKNKREKQVDIPGAQRIRQVVPPPPRQVTPEYRDPRFHHPAGPYLFPNTSSEGDLRRFFSLVHEDISAYQATELLDYMSRLFTAYTLAEQAKKAICENPFVDARTATCNQQYCDMVGWWPNKKCAGKKLAKMEGGNEWVAKKQEVQKLFKKYFAFLE